MSWFKSRYTESLESHVAELRCQLAQERQEVRRLTEALVPALQRNTGIAFYPTKGYSTAELKKAHHITKADDQQSASCACGWKAESDDPVELQTAISEHFKQNFPPIRARRDTPSERIRAAEAQSLEESQTTRTQ